jgi:hypothetical protein
VIVMVLLIMVVSIFLLGLFKKGSRRIFLDEVIPGGEVISREEGIVMYKGVQYILGTSELQMKKRLLEKLNLLQVDDTSVVDLSYHGQIIIRGDQAHDESRRK